MTIQAALYARVSSEQQATASTMASQMAALRQRMQDDGCPAREALEFVDEGISGATLIRPALERLRDRVAFGEIDRLYVHSPDRLSRKYAYQVLLCDEWQRAGVKIVFLNRAIGQTPEDDLLLQVQGMVAEYERAKILERSRRGKRHKAQSGQISVLSGAPYGYRYVPVHEGGGQARYDVVPEEAGVVRQVFDWIGRERLSLRDVCRRLARQGTPTRHGKAVWDASTLAGLLQNPAYRGMAAYGKTHVGSPHPVVRLSRRQRHRPAQGTDRVPPSQWLPIPVPALVDADLFAAAQAQLDDNRRHARRRRRGARYLLQGLVVCKHCGYAYYGKPVSRAAAKGHVRRYAYYRCIGADAYRFGGLRICDNTAVRSDALEQAVWQAVGALLERPERLMAEYHRRLQALSTPRGDATKIRLAQQINHCRQAIARLIDTYADGYLEKREFESRITQWKARQEQLLQQQQALDEASGLQAQLQLVIGRLEEFGAKVRSGLDELDWAGRRELIRTLVQRVDIDRENVSVVFRVEPVPTEEDPPRRLPLCGRREQSAAEQSVPARSARWVV